MFGRMLLALALGSTVLVQPQPLAHAATCSGQLPADMRERFELLAAEAPVIVLARITASDDVPTEGVSPLVGIAKTASFEPVVVLKQELPIEDFTIGPLRGSGPDCSGGPVMQPGEHVLLFLRPEEQYHVAAWRVGVFGDVVRFENEQALYVFAGAIDRPAAEPAGTSATVIATLSDVLSLDAATRAAAYAFVGAEAPAASSAGTTTITPPAAGDGGLR